MAQEVKVQPHYILGLNQKVKNNLFFLDEQTILFPSGNNCVVYNLDQHLTTFLPGARAYGQRKQGIQVLAVSPDKCYLAVSECKAQGLITVYDLQTEQWSKRQELTGGDIYVLEFTCMAFSANSNYLLGQSGAPEWYLFYWDWEKNAVIATVKPTNIGLVEQVSFNPKDDRKICVSGIDVFKVFKLENDSLNQTDLFNLELEHVVSHAWISEDCIIAGTETGELLMIQHREVHTLASPYESQKEESDPNENDSCTAALLNTAITPYSKGFACAAGPGVVCLYEKTEKNSYTKTTEIRIPEDPCKHQPSQAEQQEITSMCMSPSEETLAITTSQGQIYCVNLTSAEISQSKQAKFEFLLHPLHSDNITDLSTCSAKPLIATCSKDKSVRIWNYKTYSLELYKEFSEEPHCISLHPNGLSILVGFSTKLCLMNILPDKFHTVQEFAIPSCSVCVFSYDGNAFAVVRDNQIQVHYNMTGKKLELNRHKKWVMSLKWSKDNRHLVSCGMDGAVYEWNILTRAYESENVIPSCVYTDVTISPNTGSILAVGMDFRLKEIRDDDIINEVVSHDVPYTAIAMAHSGQAVFVGTSTGTIRVMQYPLKKQQAWTEHQAHSGPVTKMDVTPDNQFLLTASEDGSLLIWKITDQEGRMLNMYQSTLQEKENKLNQAHVVCRAKISKIRQNFLQEIEALTSQIQVLKTERGEQKVIQQQTLTLMMENYDKELKEKKLSNENMVYTAVRKSRELEQRVYLMKKNYEERLRQQEASHLCAVNNMKQSYEAKLQEQQAKLLKFEEQQKEMKQKADSELKEIRENYEQQVLKERETSMKHESERKHLEKQLKQVWKIQSEMLNQGNQIGKVMEEVQRLQDQRNTVKKVKDVTQDKKEQNNIIHDEEIHLQDIFEMHEMRKKMNREDLDWINRQLDDLSEERERLKLQNDEQKIKRLQCEIYENKQIIKQLKADVEEINKKNKKTLHELNQKLKVKEKELCTEKQRVRLVKIQVERMKADIQKCSQLIQQPKMLKDSVIKLHRCYV